MNETLKNWFSQNEHVFISCVEIENWLKDGQNPVPEFLSPPSHRTRESKTPKRSNIHTYMLLPLLIYMH